MNELWVFDVDGCVVDSFTGTSLRPRALELLVALRETGRTIVWWSAGGEDHARERVAQVGVSQLVDVFRAKDERRPDGRFLADDLAGHGIDVVFVDDRPEDVPVGARTVIVSPYLIHNQHDAGLQRGLAAAGLQLVR